MVKATLALVVSLLLVADPRITIDPIPPVQGDVCTVSVTGMNLPVTLTIEWEDEFGQVSEQTITVGTSGSLRVDVPDWAEGMKVKGGGAPAETTGVVPPIG